VATVERRSISQRTAPDRSPNKKDPKWLPLVSQLEELTQSDLLVLAPDADESVRALKVQVSRAANKADRKDDVLYGENPEGQLEVWLRDKPKQKRAPRKSRANTSEG